MGSLSLGDCKGGSEHDEEVQAGDTICSVDLMATASLASDANDKRPGDSSARAVSHVDNDVVGDLETCDAELNCIAQSGAAEDATLQSGAGRRRQNAAKRRMRKH